MTDPLTDLLDELAPSVDARAARDVVRRRPEAAPTSPSGHRRRARRRGGARRWDRCRAGQPGPPGRRHHVRRAGDRRPHHRRRPTTTYDHAADDNGAGDDGGDHDDRRCRCSRSTAARRSPPVTCGRRPQGACSAGPRPTARPSRRSRRVPASAGRTPWSCATRTPLGPPRSVIRSTSPGTTGGCSSAAAGQGQISWVLDDGSEAYVRSRGLSADQLSAIATALSARPVDAAVPGFDLTAAAPAGFALVAETTAPLDGQHRVDAVPSADWDRPAGRRPRRRAGGAVRDRARRVAVADPPATGRPRRHGERPRTPRPPPPPSGSSHRARPPTRRRRASRRHPRSASRSPDRRPANPVARRRHVASSTSPSAASSPARRSPSPATARPPVRSARPQ